LDWQVKLGHIADSRSSPTPSPHGSRENLVFENPAFA
jgi:hypothetical protein